MGWIMCKCFGNCKWIGKVFNKDLKSIFDFMLIESCTLGVIHKPCGPIFRTFWPPPACGHNMDFWLYPLANHVDFSDTPPLLKIFYNKIIHNLLVFFSIFFIIEMQIIYFLKIIFGFLTRKKSTWTIPLTPSPPLLVHMVYEWPPE